MGRRFYGRWDRPHGDDTPQDAASTLDVFLRRTAVCLWCVVLGLGIAWAIWEWG